MYFLKITKGRKPKSNSISMKLGKLIISDPLLLLVLDIEYRHYEKSYTGMNVFRKGMNSFRNGMKTFRIGTGIRGNQNYQKIRNFSGSRNLKEFFQNSNFLDLVWFGMSFLKPWNFEKILSDSYSLKNF